MFTAMFAARCSLYSIRLIAQRWHQQIVDDRSQVQRVEVKTFEWGKTTEGMIAKQVVREDVSMSAAGFLDAAIASL